MSAGAVVLIAALIVICVWVVTELFRPDDDRDWWDDGPSV